MYDDEFLFQEFLWLLALEEHLYSARASVRKSSFVDVKKIYIDGH